MKTMGRSLVLFYILFSPTATSFKVSSRAEIELSHDALFKTITSVAESLRHHRLDKSVIPQIQAMETTVLGLLSSKNTTPGMLAFVTTVLNITDKQMKPAILWHLGNSSKAVQNAVTPFYDCVDKFNNKSKPGLNLIGSLPSRKEKLDKCIYETLIVSDLTSASNLSKVDMNYVNYQIITGKADRTRLSKHITGWSTLSSSRPVAQSCPVGYGPLTTSTVCKEMEDHCKDFRDANGIPEFEICDAILPAFISSSIPSTCGSGSTSCCKNPFANECSKTGYIDQGAYYTAMADYWGAMIDLWDRSRADCLDYCERCQGNQTNCPVDGVKFDVCPFVETTSPTTATTTTSRNYTYSSNCTTEQEEMDVAACDGTTQSLDACKVYDTCYEQEKGRYNVSYICGPNGDLEILKNQYYAVLRIECLLFALNTTNGSVYMKDQIEICRLKTIADYNLSMFKIPACDDGIPANMGILAYQICRDLSNVPAYQNCSGTTPYADEYYQYIPYPKPCTTSCCLNLPQNFVPAEVLQTYNGSNLSNRSLLNWPDWAR